jgi:hypothetical protein
MSNFVFEWPRYEEVLITLRRLHFGANFEVNIGRPAIQARNATWVSGTDSEFPVGSRKTTENLIELAG